MIAVVQRMLADLGLVHAGVPLRYHAGLTRGDTLWVDAFVEGERFVHVKLAEFVSLRDEVAAYRAAARIYGDFMPKPIAYEVRDGWHVFVTEGVEHRPLLAKRSDASFVGAVHELSQFFLLQRGAKEAAHDAPAHAELVERLARRFAASPFADVVARWRDGAGARELAALGRVAQHGDFVPNNLGVCGSRAVVFDWEDYGKTALPGLDLCTLVMSSLDAGETRTLVDGTMPRRLRDAIAPACAALDLDFEQWRRLVPLYLLAFLHLKDAYASEVRLRVGRLLDELREAAAP